MTDFTTVELDIELLTDVCFSTSNRTLGEPETLTCIPGRTLWGAAASRAYRHKMPDVDAFRIFHQGAVRIHDAVPVHGERRSYPTPGAWHRPKKDLEEDAYVASNFADPKVRTKNTGVQCRPLKANWMAPDGDRAVTFKVKTSRSMRTSIDVTGRPRDGLLYGIPVVLAGTRFWTAVSGPQADVETVVAHLVSGDIRVGRSRNQEMGLVCITRRTEPIGFVPSGSGSHGTVSLLCASRCLLRDPSSGSPTTVPFPAAFGLDGAWTFDEASSFVRTTRIVHFNAKRVRPETDRFAIERGSVVTFKSATATCDLEALQTRLRGGVGEHTGQGYGEVLVSPAWLTRPEIAITAFKEGGAGSAVAPPSDKLYAWALERANARGRAVNAYREARKKAAELRRFGVPPAQWGALHKMAREARFRGNEQSLRKLFETGGYFDSGARKLSPKWKRAKKALQDLFNECAAGELPLFLEHLAGACMRETGETKERGES